MAELPGPPPGAAVDFLSPHFDAAQALTTPGLQPPDQDARPLDYVAKFRCISACFMELLHDTECSMKELQECIRGIRSSSPHSVLNNQHSCSRLACAA
jgi:hypothetical protein